MNIPDPDAIDRGDLRDSVRERAAAGFGPAPRPVASLPTASRAAAAVLELLEAQEGPTTVADLAQQAGQHPNTIREHLDTLVEEGLARRERASTEGRGRPSWLYAALPPREPAPEYAGLATALAMQIARSSKAPREDALEAGAAWGADLASRTDEPATPAGARLGVVELLETLGFDPAADARTTHVRLRQCPLLEAAKAQPEVVCSVHLGLVRGALERWDTRSDATSLEPFAEPGACLLHLTGATRRSA